MKITDIIPREVKIPIFRFDPVKHRYYLDDKQLTGVTTILGVLAKPALISWASKMACEYVRENLKSMEELETVLEKAKNAHAQKRDKAADTGTLAHRWIEDYIGGKNPERNEAIAVITDNFLKWVEEKKPKFLASEKVVHSKEHWYAGTLDFIAEIDGKVYLGDIKTGSGIYKEMFMQTAGYQLALEETEPEMKIDGHIVVNPTKDGKLNVETHFDYGTSKQGFLSCLTLYKILNQQL